MCYQVLVNKKDSIASAVAHTAIFAMNSYVCISMYVQNTAYCYAYYEVLPMQIARYADNERSRYGSNVHSNFQG